MTWRSGCCSSAGAAACSEDGPGVVAASLLAHEIASVIDRADMIGQLTDEALTDALTGLPNRRAWDAELARAMQGRVPVAVAMLDIDHFKRFNDTQRAPGRRPPAARGRIPLALRDACAETFSRGWAARSSRCS